MEDKWELIQDIGEYRDFENFAWGEGFGRITFNVLEGTAYAQMANPNATAENDEDLFLDEFKTLTWEQAETIVGSKQELAVSTKGIETLKKLNILRIGE
jgi:hypothetical protein